jgi:hypothetical protein
MSAAVVAGLRSNLSCCATRLCRGDQNPVLCYLERSEDGRSSNQKKVGKTIGSWARQLTVDRRPAPSGAFLGRHRPAAVNSRRVVLLAWRSA